MFYGYYPSLAVRLTFISGPIMFLRRGVLFSPLFIFIILVFSHSVWEARLILGQQGREMDYIAIV